MKKKWILIAVLAVLLAAILLIWKFGGAEKESERVEAPNPPAQTEAEPASAAVEPTAEPETSPEPAEETSQALILENEGDIEIIIPDDQASDGF